MSVKEDVLQLCEEVLPFVGPEEAQEWHEYLRKIGCGSYVEDENGDLVLFIDVRERPLVNALDRDIDREMKILEDYIFTEEGFKPRVRNVHITTVSKGNRR